MTSGGEFLEVTDEFDMLASSDAQARPRKRGGRKHRGTGQRKTIDIFELILELPDDDLRENALRCLSGYLVEKREVDPDLYTLAGFYIYYSFGTVAILVHEVLSAYPRLLDGDMTIRGSKRLANVLSLFQVVAHNEDTRKLLVAARTPEVIMPFILSTEASNNEPFENARFMSLSVLGVLCQAGEKVVAKWALDSNLIGTCLHALRWGGELSQTVIDEGYKPFG